jgi:hypothetical protein
MLCAVTELSIQSDLLSSAVLLHRARAMPTASACECVCEHQMPATMLRIVCATHTLCYCGYTTAFVFLTTNSTVLCGKCTHSTGYTVTTSVCQAVHRAVIACKYVGGTMAATGSALHGKIASSSYEQWITIRSCTLTQHGAAAAQWTDQTRSAQPQLNAHALTCLPKLLQCANPPLQLYKQ